MSVMSELHASIHQPDPAMDMYRLEAVVTDLRGHHPDELDEQRVYGCIQKLIAILAARKDAAA